MTAAAHSKLIEDPPLATISDENAMAAEIRILQSVQTQRSMPVLLVGNLAAVAITCYIDWRAVLASHAVYFLVLLLVLLLPMVRSFVRLRGRARPTNVSKRRVSIIQIYSFLMGMCWAAVAILLMPLLSNIDAVTFLMLIYFLGYGSVSLTPSIPFAAAAYFAPMLTASFVAGLVYDVMRADLLIFITFCASLAMSRTLQQSWQDVREMVRTSLERLAAEAQLRQREAQTAFFEKERQNEISRTQRNLIDAIPFPLVMTKEDSFLPVGTQASQLFKVDFSKVQIRTIADFFVDPLEQQKMVAMQNVNGQLDEYETQLRDTEGKPFWVMVSSRPLEYEGENCWLNSIVVIDDRKRAEQALADKEEQLRLVLDNMPGGIRLVDAEKKIVFFNQQYLDLYDFPPDLLKIGETNFAESFHQAQRGDFGPGDPKDLVANWLGELPVQTEPSGWERTTVFGKTVQVSTSPMPDGGWVNVVTDVTERKAAETEQELAKQRLEEQTNMLETVSNQLAKYISPQLYQAIFTGEQKVAIESKRRKLTIFFSDIANFTEITDQLESEELTALLNQYLTEMSKIALAHGANFDKFIGDAMMFYFGDPETKGIKEDASACVRMAIAMQRRMHEIQDEWYEQGLEQPFELRIGINTGYCTVGNFGSEDRMDYTIIGSDVNLAARLQSHANVGSILLANETHSLVKDWLLAEEREAITVKGFAKPIRTFSVKGSYEDLGEDGRVIHLEDKGLSLTIDKDQLDRERKLEVIAKLKNALAELED